MEISEDGIIRYIVFSKQQPTIHMCKLPKMKNWFLKPNKGPTPHRKKIIFYLPKKVQFAYIINWKKLIDYKLGLARGKIFNLKTCKRTAPATDFTFKTLQGQYVEPTARHDSYPDLRGSDQ